MIPPPTPPPPPPPLLSIADRSNVGVDAPRRDRVNPQPTISALSVGVFYSQLIARLSPLLPVATPKPPSLLRICSLSCNRERNVTLRPSLWGAREMPREDEVSHQAAIRRLSFLW